ncbi:hypothetical protein [Pararhizobium sp. DWP1-1-3]|uniref:hypothetical protein n=1 Tax=Pararhizobium sp. DWP1-1-3 TaxID=2804652 RepID=UPI003CF1F520
MPNRALSSDCRPVPVFRIIDRTWLPTADAVLPGDIDGSHALVTSRDIRVCAGVRSNSAISVSGFRRISSSKSSIKAKARDYGKNAGEWGQTVQGER